MPVELQPGVIVAGKLRLSRPLGQGGMGVVWAARHLALETEVAVKFIRPERAQADPGLLARFEREARATARIADPHVVQVMDYGTVDGTVPYLVMELLRGASLAELLEQGGRLSFATAKLLVHQVGNALASAHERGVIHRDVKPHNVFITEGGRGYPLFVKVLDFGVAKMLGDAAVPDPGPTLTETGVVLGSAPYMSPEQLEGSKDVDLRSDLWSLGVLVYEALTGVQPFRGASFVSVGAAVLRGKYGPATELRPDLPPAVDDWFAKALSLDPEGRFASARAMAAAFQELEPPPLALPSPAAPDESRSSALASPGGAVVPFATTIDALEAGRSEAAPDARERASRLPEPPLPLLEGRTVDHAPLAARPSTPGSRRRFVAVGALAAALLVGALGLSARARGRVAGTCPAGMVLVDGATFPMGSAADAETPSDETPVHAASVRSFCLDATEVTVAAYARCTSCEAPRREVEFEGLTPNARAFESTFCNREDAPEHPLNCVDYNQAKAYCAAVGKRLPTEAEWELAARGKERRTYPWGFAPPSGKRLNACGIECSRMLTARRQAVGKGRWPAMYDDDDGAPATSPVGRYPAGATPEGVLDLAGNVWEWTDSVYCPYGEDDCGDSRRVVRGGGWDTTESQDLRAARRYPSAPTARGRSIGFRCAKDP